MKLFVSKEEGCWYSEMVIVVVFLWNLTLTLHPSTSQDRHKHFIIQQQSLKLHCGSFQFQVNSTVI